MPIPQLNSPVPSEFLFIHETLGLQPAVNAGSLSAEARASASLVTPNEVALQHLLGHPNHRFPDSIDGLIRGEETGSLEGNIAVRLERIRASAVETEGFLAVRAAFSNVLLHPERDSAFDMLEVIRTIGETNVGWNDRIARVSRLFVKKAITFAPALSDAFVITNERKRRHAISEQHKFQWDWIFTSTTSA
jgi:hypothetical protein